MPVEIRELHIKGSVIGNSQIEKQFRERNSPLLQSQLVDRLKKDIIKDCLEAIEDKLDRKNYR